MSFFRKIIDFIKSPIGRLGREPAYDWYFALYCFALGLIIIFSINIFMFFRLTSNTTTSEDSQTGKSVQITKVKIDQTVEKATQGDINASSIPLELFADPSVR